MITQKDFKSSTFLYDSLVENTRVTGTAVDTYAVGGVVGYHNWSTISRDSIKDSVVNNNGDRTGGFVGLFQNGIIKNIYEELH